MGEISITVSAETVAWYGAIIATLSLVIAATKLFADRRRLRVSVDYGILKGVGDERTKVFISAANIGKRPITVNSLGLRFKDNTEIIIRQTPNLNMPHTLNEGEDCRTWIDKEELVASLAENNKQLSDIEYGWYRDATSKYFTGKYKLKW